ncbi:hypothetical protein TH1_144 [Shewanella phage Thanatos-1]|nr:hypothetical protein TH1_144 [Shewanella phage Thanatos-1]
MMILFKKNHLKKKAFTELRTLSTMIKPEMFDDGDVRFGDFKYESLYSETEAQICKCALSVLEYIELLTKKDRSFQEGICGTIFEVLRKDILWVDDSCQCLIPRRYDASVIAESISEIIVNICKKIWVDWEHFSGSSYYPIQSPLADASPMQYFHFTSAEGGLKWKGEYGKQRKELLSFLIKSLKEKV